MEGVLSRVKSHRFLTVRFQKKRFLPVYMYSGCTSMAIFKYATILGCFGGVFVDMK